jgi:hypothetical protein
MPLPFAKQPVLDTIARSTQDSVRLKFRPPIHYPTYQEKRDVISVTWRTFYFQIGNLLW